MLLILFGAIYGNKPNPFFGGRGMVDVSVPSYIGLIIISCAFMSIPIATAANREAGVLRRFRMTPLRPAAYISANIVTYYVMTVLGVAALVLVGRTVYGMKFDGNLLSVWAGFTLSALAFFSLGYLIAGAAPTARSAQAVGHDLRLSDDVPRRRDHSSRGPSPGRPLGFPVRPPHPCRHPDARALGRGELGEPSDRGRRPRRDSRRRDAPQRPLFPLGIIVADMARLIMKKHLRGWIVLFVFAAWVAVYFLFAHPWLVQWGSTPEEQARVFPGDDLTPVAVRQGTRAVTIAGSRRTRSGRG